MKRLALVLAAALSGTGCFVVDDDCFGTVTLQWDFERANGDVALCAGAGVAYVDVFMNDALVDRFFCVDGGVTVTDVRSGHHRFTVEGLDAGEAIRYREEFVVDARRCEDPFIATRPSQGTVVVDYSFSPDNACFGGPTFMSLQVRDDLALSTAFFEPPTTGDACTVTGAAPAYVLPTGTFTLQWIHEMEALVGGGFQVRARDCSDRSFTVPPVGSTTVSPVLVDDVAACPESL
jgi:hypothetical protein